MLTWNCIYILMVTIFLTIMVVLAANSPLPATHKALLGGSLSNRVSGYGVFARSISLDARSQQREWSKEFLAKREAAPHSAPYIVSIQTMTNGQGPVHYCAGTIINENWILTAAHCLQSHETVENSIIMAGCHDVHGNEADCVQMRTIDYYVTHELYLGGVNPYDIALIYTKQPLQFTQYVQPAHLPEQDAEPLGFGTLYGWGNISMTAVPHYPHRLQEANMPILDMELCEKVLAAAGFELHETNMCTGPLTGGVSICTADSGGPLVQHCCDYFEEGFTVIGIVSWGKMPCGQKNAPSVFVRVSAFSNWIYQIISTATHIE